MSPHAWESLTPAVWQFSSACISPAIWSKVSACCNIQARRIRERLKLTVAFEELWIDNPRKLGYLLWCGCAELCRKAWEYRVNCIKVICFWLRQLICPHMT